MPRKKATPSSAAPKKRTPRTKKASAPAKPDTGNSILDDALSLSTMGIAVRGLKSITDLIHDRQSMLQTAEMLAAGGSVETIEMALGVDKGVIKGWLKIGKTERDGPYRAFYQFFLQASAEARLAAESSLLLKNPSSWLDRNDPIAMLEDSDNGNNESGIIDGSIENPNEPLEETDTNSASTDNLPDSYGTASFD